MQENKLISLLLKISETLSSIGLLGAQDELLKLFSEVLDTSGCAVYLLKENKFSLNKQHSNIYSFEFFSSLDLYELTFSNAAVYINDSEKACRYFRGDVMNKCLFLPLQKQDKLEGVLLAGWKDHSPLDFLDHDSFRLFLPISQILFDVYANSSMLASIVQREKSLIALYQKAERELENSRKQVSLELHDEVGQVLTSILLQLKLLQQSEDLEYIKGRLGGLHYITMQTIEEVRRISTNLRPSLLEKLGLQPAFEAHIKEFIKSTGIDVDFRCTNVGRRLPDQIEIIVYRAVQEGLTNVARHAEASVVFINLSAKGDHLLLQISDNGKGMSDNENKGLGLLGIKERVNLADGKLWIVNHKGKGLSLNIILPLDVNKREMKLNG